jgi:hypothetical protein
MEKQKFFIDKIYKIYRLRDEVISSNYHEKTFTKMEYVSIHNTESEAIEAMMELDAFSSYTIVPIYSKQIHLGKEEWEKEPWEE